MFGRKKKTETCCCTGNCSTESMKAAEEMKKTGARVKILGSGCAKCNELEANAKSAMETLGLIPEIEHVTDFIQIASYGVMTTPALVIDGKVVSLGKVLTVDELKDLF